MTRAGARGHHAWVEARRNDDFASFLPYLRRNVELKRRYVECFEWSDSPYTPLLDDYEPGMLTTEVREVFAVLRAGAHRDRRLGTRGRRLVPPRAISRRTTQRAFAERVVATLGFESGAWRLDPTAHPFCTSFSNRDVRLTTRYRPTTSSRSGRRCTRRVTGSTHTGSPTRSSARRSAARRRSGSTSRRAGRGRTSSAAAGRSGSTGTSRCRRRSPRSATSTLDDFVRAINRAEPGLIRVDADETTYSLHIILRFELEQEMLEGTVALEDLPEIWNARMKEFLGVDVPNDARRRPPGRPLVGRRDRLLPDLRARQRDLAPALARRPAGASRSRRRSSRPATLMPLSDWLRDNLYSLGRKLTPKETIERLTGSPEIDPAPYLAYLRDKLAALVA